MPIIFTILILCVGFGVIVSVSYFTRFYKEKPTEYFETRFLKREQMQVDF